MFDKVDEFIRDYNGTKHLILFGSEKNNVIFNRTKYLISLKIIFHMLFLNFYNYAKM